MHVIQRAVEINKSWERSGYSPEPIRLRRGEHGLTQIAITLTDNGVPFDLSETTVRFCAQYKGGYFVREEMEVSGSRAELTVTSSLTAVEGKAAVAYVEVTQGDTRIASDDIPLYIMPEVDIDSGTEAAYKNEIDAILEEGRKAADELASKTGQFDANEQARQDAEEKRAAAEATRETQEAARQEKIGEVDKALEDAQQAVQDASEAKESANEAAQKANEATESANSAATSANEAAQSASEASKSANEAAEKANTATETATSTLESYADAEKERVANEEARVEAENARADAESLREEAETARGEAESGRASGEATRESQEAERQAAESLRVTAEQGRVDADSERETRQAVNDSAQVANDLAQAKNNADQAANNAAAMGRLVRILKEGEYDESGPTIEGEVGIIYLVPYTDGEAPDLYAEWIWVEGSWEKIPGGSTTLTINPITTDQTDQIIAGEEVTGDELLNATGLSYYDKASKARNDGLYDALGAASEVDEKVTALTSTVMNDKAAQATKDSDQDAAIASAQTNAEKTAADALEAAVSAQADVDAKQDTAIQTAQSAAESAQSAIAPAVSAADTALRTWVQNEAKAHAAGSADSATTAATANALGSADVGSTTSPIFLSKGIPTAIAKVAAAAMADQATKLGNATVGNTTTGIYLDGGTPKATTGSSGPTQADFEALQAKVTALEQTVKWDSVHLTGQYGYIIYDITIFRHGYICCVYCYLHRVGGTSPNPVDPYAPEGYRPVVDTAITSRVKLTADGHFEIYNYNDGEGTYAVTYAVAQSS